MQINEQNLELLRQNVMDDSNISESERQRSLDAIAGVEQGINSGEFTVIDRTAMIKDVVEGKRNNLRKKLKSKSHKVMRNATEDTRLMQSLDAFDEKFMYSSEEEVRRYADGMGITEVYNETKRFDNQWD